MPGAALGNKDLINTVRVFEKTVAYPATPAAREPVHIRCFKKRLWVGLTTDHTAAVAADVWISTDRDFLNAVVRRIPLEGIEFEGFSREFHGCEKYMEFYIEPLDGSTIVEVMEWE